MLILCLAIGLGLGSPEMLPVGPDESVAVTVATTHEGPVVMLIPGLSGSAFGYRHVIAGLDLAEVACVTVEPLGIGLSGRPRHADYTLAAQAARLALVCDSLALKQTVVVCQGVAMGMVLRLALIRPDLVAGIVSIEGAAAESAATPTVRSGLKLAKLVTSLGGDAAIRERFTQNLKAASGDDSWVDRGTVRQYMRGPGGDLQATIDVFLAMATTSEPMSIGPRLGEITVPVRVLRGLAPHAGELGEDEIAILTTGLSDCRIIGVPGAGHFLQEERPDIVIDTVIGVLDLLAGSSGAGYEVVVD